MALQKNIFFGSFLTIPRCLVITALLGLHVLNIQAEYFSSIDKIQMISLTEKDFLQWYRNFTASQAEDFAVYRNFITKVKKHHAVALEDPEAFLSNPINAFKLIKRTVDEWAQISDYVNNQTGLHALKTNLTKLESLIQLPDSSELRGASKGLGRIQTMYNISSHNLAHGVINDKNYKTELSASDCFEIGANLFEAKEYHLAIDWFELTLKYLKKNKSTNATKNEKEVEMDEIIKFSNIDDDVSYKSKEHENNRELDEAESDDDDYDYASEDGEAALFNEGTDMLDNDEELGDINEDEERISPILKKAQLRKSTLPTERVLGDEQIFISTLEYLALGKYELGHRDEAISYIQQILELHPEHTFKDIEIYMRFKEPRNKEDPDSLRALRNKMWFANYTRLCQGKQLPEKDLHKLTCTLDSLNHPLFILAPLKRELLLSDPEVVLYHGLLSNKQMLNILKESYLHMRRSEVGNGLDINMDDVRNSQQAWLEYNTSTTKYIYNTVAAISGYNLENAEVMQVVNYGIGGQFDPHHDCTLDENYETLIGDRLSTHLFYISDVDVGGNTVFPFLNVYSKPEKGAMLMWHNLHKSLEPDIRTLHAGCPVVVGTKRITNVWVHSGYQDNKRPCDVVRDSYKSIPFFKFFEV